MTEPYELPQRPKTDAWIERVRAADAEAEIRWQHVRDSAVQAEPEAVEADIMAAISLIAIAAELRAQRIARRPGAGH